VDRDLRLSSEVLDRGADLSNGFNAVFTVANAEPVVGTACHLAQGPKLPQLLLVEVVRPKINLELDHTPDGSLGSLTASTSISYFLGHRYAPVSSPSKNWHELAEPN
jgi:hypothetical protein